MDDFSKAIKNGDAIPYDEAVSLGKENREARERKLEHGCDIASDKSECWGIDELIRKAKDDSPKAKHKRRSAGLELIKEFIETLDHNEPLNKYMVDCLLDVIAGKNPLEALNVKAYNRPKENHTKRDLEIFHQLQSRIDSGVDVLQVLVDFEQSENNVDKLSSEKLRKIYYFNKPIIERQQKQSY